MNFVTKKCSWVMGSSFVKVFTRILIKVPVAWVTVIVPLGGTLGRLKPLSRCQ